MTLLTRRRALRLSAAAGGTLALPGIRAARAQQETESYGLSTFGELAQPADFKFFAYVNPQAPKGGTLSIQLKQASGNQNFDTFDTLNIYVFRGAGAAGMDATFDTLMAGSGDEPDAAYGLVARAVRFSDDRLTYRFMLRKEARFNDGSPLKANDVAFSLNVLKDKGHPGFRLLLDKVESVVAEADDVVTVKLAQDRSRSLHLAVASLPIFSEAWWKGRDFEGATLEAPLGSGPYKVARFEQGRFIEFERVKDYWAGDLPVNVGTNNFDRLRYEYYRERQVAFEAFKAGSINFNQEYTARIWATGYDFPAIRDGKVKKEEIHDGEPTRSQGWYFNLRRPAFQDARVREAIALCFDFEWTNKNIMFSAYQRMTSFFENSPQKAVGKAPADEAALLEPFRAQLPAEVFGEPWLPPVSDGSGSDRALLRKADDLLRAAGCKRDGNRLLTPAGQPFVVEFLDFSPALQPHTEPFQANLKKLGIDARSRVVDAAQYQSRTNAFDFDVISQALSGTSTPGDSLRDVFGSKGAATQGSRNLAGISSPAVDALLALISNAEKRADLEVACRALDRVLRAGRYWVPMWYNDRAFIAHWDVFARPERAPKYSTGAPGTWWYDAEKARRIGRAG